MGLPRIRFALPVLSRELFEMSARRRTFIQRSVFAGVFLGIVFWNQSQRMGYSGNGLFDVLGSGRWMFEQLVWWQFAAVILVMPLITCGAIVQEKQRDTLALLLTTKTTPAGIIVQKLISRVCLMLTLLLVALPLVGAFASLFDQRGVSPLQVDALRPVSESNCVVVRRGGKQLEENDQSVTVVNSIRPGCLASLPSYGEAQTGNVGKFDIVGSP